MPGTISIFIKISASVPLEIGRKLNVHKKFGRPLGRLLNVLYTLKCPYSEFFWSVFSSIGTEYGDL